MNDLAGFTGFVQFLENETKGFEDFNVCIALIPKDTQLGDVVDVDEKPVIGLEKLDEPDKEIVWLVKSKDEKNSNRPPGLTVRGMISQMNEWGTECGDYEMVVGENIPLNGENYQFHQPIRTMALKPVLERNILRILVWKNEI